MKRFAVNSRKSKDHANREGRVGFTLIELLVVLAVVAVLAATLFPVLAGTGPNSKAVRCSNNLRQLSAAWAMYPDDYTDSVMPNPGWVTGTMDWTSTPANTNVALLVDPSSALIARYVQSSALFKCPADIYQGPASPGPRVRSVSLNGALAGIGGSGPSVRGTTPGNRKYYGSGSGGAGRALQKISELNLPGPGKTCLILDEHADSINDGAFMFDPGYAYGNEVWRDLPASYHDGSVSLSFSDGHTELYKWRKSTTLYPITFNSSVSPKPWQTVTLGRSQDYEWLQDHMPYRY